MKSFFKKNFYTCLLLSDNYLIFIELKKSTKCLHYMLGSRRPIQFISAAFIRIETGDYNNSQ